MARFFWLGARFKVFAVQEWLIWFFKLHLDCSGLGLSFGSFFLLLLIHRSEHKIGIFEFELSDSIFGSLVI